MSEFHMPEIPEVPGQGTVQEQKPAQILSMTSPVSQSFVWMALGLLVSTAVSLFTAMTGLTYTLLMANPMIYLGLIIAELGVTVLFCARLQKASVSSLRMMFLVYAVLTGLSLSVICEGYTSATVYAAFGISAFYFGCLAVIGLTTKLDLSKVGAVCTIGLVVMLISMVVLLIFGMPMSTVGFSIFGLVLFTGITAWDVSRISKIMTLNEGNPVEQDRWSIYFAMNLYLDFINIFLYVLRLLGKGSGNRR